MKKKTVAALWMALGIIAICVMFGTLNCMDRDAAHATEEVTPYPTCPISTPATTSYNAAITNARRVGIEAAKAAGIELSWAEWSQVRAQREELGENAPHCYWYDVYSATLYTCVDGVEARLSPKEALFLYGDNHEFMLEYAYLVQMIRY
jgi:hypothetical protein